MAYLIGAFIGAVLFGGLIATGIDRGILRRFVDDPIMSIAWSGLLAFVLVTGLGAIGHADGGPVRLTNVPYMTYALGLATMTWLRIRAYTRKLDKADAGL